MEQSNRRSINEGDVDIHDDYHKTDWGVFQLEMVKIVLTSHFHKKVRATIGLVPSSQLP